MTRHPLHQKIVDCIVKALPEQFFRSYQENVDHAFAAAVKEASIFRPEQQQRALGQLRHFHLNDALRRSADSCQLWNAAPATNPPGDRPSIVVHGQLALGRVSLNLRRGYVRPSKFRRAIAILNEHLVPRSIDMFNPVPPLPADKGIGVLLVTVNPPRGYPDMTTVMGIFVAVPTPDLKSWFLYTPLSTVIAAYHQAVVLPDAARVTLKKKATREQKNNDNKDSTAKGR